MNSFLKYFQIILSLLPSAFGIVQQVEQLHQSKSGEEKKAAAMEIIRNASQAAQTVVPSEAASAQIAEKAMDHTIDIAVSALNEAGVFKAGSTGASAAVPVPGNASAAIVDTNTPVK